MRSREEIREEWNGHSIEYRKENTVPLIVELLLDIRELLQEKEKPKNKTTEKMEKLMNKKYKGEAS